MTDVKNSFPIVLESELRTTQKEVKMLRNKVNFFLKKLKSYPCICEDNLSLCFKCGVMDDYNKTDFNITEV